MLRSEWTDERLDAFRRMGDPLADDLVRAVFEAGEIDAVRRLLRTLVDNEHPLFLSAEEAAKLGPEVTATIERYFEASDRELPTVEPDRVERGERVFAEHGPEVLMTLCCYSLPAAYAARKGVQVLAQTGRLESHPKRRLFETTQMVIDVMSPGGLDRSTEARFHGKGIRTAQKVRLMHAAVRHMILHHYGDQWTGEFGVPINQEDLAGTLMTFSWIVLDGLEKLGAELSPADREDYLHSWQAIGRVMGVHEQLIPATVAEAAELTRIIQARQIAPSQQGDDLTRALVEMMREMLEARFLRGLPPTMIRFFLGKWAEVIHLPPDDWTVVLVRIVHGCVRFFDRLFTTRRLSRALYRHFNIALIEAMLLVERGGTRPSFDIPDHLAVRWDVRKA